MQLIYVKGCSVQSKIPAPTRNGLEMKIEKLGYLPYFSMRMIYRSSRYGKKLKVFFFFQSFLPYRDDLYFILIENYGRYPSFSIVIRMSIDQSWPIRHRPMSNRYPITVSITSVMCVQKLSTNFLTIKRFFPIFVCAICNFIILLILG